MSKKLKQAGFTIVELLIVVVVVAILVAVSVVAYNGTQERVRISVLQSDIVNFSKKVALYYAEDNTYPNTKTHMESLGWRPSTGVYQLGASGNALYCAIPTGQNARFIFAARTSNNKAYVYSSSSGDIKEYTGSWTGAWASDCPYHGIPTDESGMTFAQGYQPPNWGTPGWKMWAGGTVDGM